MDRTYRLFRSPSLYFSVFLFLLLLFLRPPKPIFLELMTLTSLIIVNILTAPIIFLILISLTTLIPLITLIVLTILVDLMTLITLVTLIIT